MLEINNSVLVLQTGGTIDKCYPKTVGGYAFDIGDPAVRKILSRAGVDYPMILDYVTVCRKDSQDINGNDRSQILLGIRRALQRRILITHGTDSMIQTAQFLGPRITDKVVILTGSRLPETFKESDADFNVGLALGALQFAHTPGVYVAMNGAVHLWSEVDRDMISGHFIKGKL